MNSTEITADRPAVRRLRALGVDVRQLAHQRKCHAL